MNYERAEGFWRIRWLDGPRRGEQEVVEVARPKPGVRPEDEWVRTIDGFTSLRHLWIKFGASTTVALAVTIPLVVVVQFAIDHFYEEKDKP